MRLTPAFATDELVVLNFQYSGHLWDSYQAARVKGFQNAMGKFLFVELGNFLINIHPLCLYTSACSTNPKGDAQPGNFLVILTDECRELRANSTPKIRKQQRRIADYVMYDRRNDMYSIVGEIKSDARDDAEVQNVEQMVGLFRQRQQAMLGFTCNKTENIDPTSGYTETDCSTAVEPGRGGIFRINAKTSTTVPSIYKHC